MPLSPASSHGSSGGISSATTDQWRGNNVNLADGATGQLTWDTLQLGSGLIQTTSPGTLTDPTFITAGVYIVTVSARPTGALTSGGWRLNFELDRNNQDINARADGAIYAATAAPFLTATLSGLMAAGSTLRVSVTNNGGAANNFFLFEGNVTKLQ